MEGVQIKKFSELGGYQEQKNELKKLANLYSNHIFHFRDLGLTEVTKSILISGPGGAGKSAFAKAFCLELGFPCKIVNCVELISGITGQLEARIRNLVEEAKANSPCTILFEDIDIIANEKSGSSGKQEGN